jgi:hypothetical protein
MTLPRIYTLQVTSGLPVPGSGDTSVWYDRWSIVAPLAPYLNVDRTTWAGILECLFAVPFRIVDQFGNVWRLSSFDISSSMPLDCQQAYAAGYPLPDTSHVEITGGVSANFDSVAAATNDPTDFPGVPAATLTPIGPGFYCPGATPSWPNGIFLLIEYVSESISAAWVASATSSGADASPTSLFVRYLLTGEPGVTDITSVCCDPPVWWPDAIAYDDGAARTMLKNMVAFWQSQNYPDSPSPAPSVDYLEDRLSLSSSYPRRILEMSYPLRHPDGSYQTDGFGFALYSVPSTRPTSYAVTPIVGADCEYPCATDIVANLDPFTAALEAILGQLSGLGDNLADISLSAKCLATLELLLSLPFNGLVISARTGPTTEGSP